MAGEWSIQDLAKAAGTTSRTLRHYGERGLLEPSRIGANGYRYYDQDALVRLQRILLLRELGLGLPAIAEVLGGERDTAAALRTHLALLEQELGRVRRQIESVRTTLQKTEGGEQLMAEEVFDGFDHTRHKDEVIERWGEQAYESGDRWWRGQTGEQRRAWQAALAQLNADWIDATESASAPDGERAQELARRHVEWLGGIPGTPGHGAAPVKEYILGLGEMYVADERFAANYGGTRGAAFVRDALTVYAQRNL
ncbi:MerR family transcriptional regulator [Rhodococcus maanshanensis]|uniref:DNA-binding transcriptional regulator, MerR family n=1 Tax=Rhodococcus maanshanensis TaxID=183556 RepID=A0A1H7VCI8_9NOCA|nr:MerR family transcriptional regulator [Rhodococcus maanshanensis]SEM06599.1 DNA-binding transcriptional regulator, MerR family [Rhodococcus maanshanensis]